jgi:hypothetical protein
VRECSFAAAGHEERDVARAFLESLAPWAAEQGTSRRRLRALRHPFKAVDEMRDLRAAIAAIVGVPAASIDRGSAGAPRRMAR